MRNVPVARRYIKKAAGSEEKIHESRAKQDENVNRSFDEVFLSFDHRRTVKKFRLLFRRVRAARFRAREVERAEQLPAFPAQIPNPRVEFHHLVGRNVLFFFASVARLFRVTYHFPLLPYRDSPLNRL